MGLEIDESRFPRVRIVFSGNASDVDVRNVLAGVDRWLARGEPFALLLESRGGIPFGSAQRSAVIEHMKANRAATDRFLIQALVIDSALLRAFYYAVGWAFPMGFPSKVFGDVASADAWLDAQLQTRQREAKSKPAA